MRNTSLICLFISAGCASLEGAKPALQIALEKQLLGVGVYAQCALHRSFFFDDPTRDLVSPFRPGARHLALDASGKPVPLIAKTNRVHPGSKWRLSRISLATPFERLMRPLRSPRHLTWLHLRAGSSKIIVVVPEAHTTAAAVRAWLQPQFSSDEPAGLLSLSPALRDAVVNGRLIPEMSAEQVRLALCEPDRIYKDVGAIPPVEKWIYLHQDGDHRVAVLLAGRSTGRVVPLKAADLKALETKPQPSGATVEAK